MWRSWYMTIGLWSLQRLPMTGDSQPNVIGLLMVGPCYFGALGVRAME